MRGSSPAAGQIGPAGPLPRGPQDQTRRLPGSTALAQARESGAFTTAHEAFWAAARRVNGDADGTRALIDVLLLHRSCDAEDVDRRDHRGAGGGRCQRRRRRGRGPQTRSQLTGWGQRRTVIPVPSTSRIRATGCQPDPAPARRTPPRSSPGSRPTPGPLPSVSAYDELLAKRAGHPPASPRRRRTCS